MTYPRGTRRRCALVRPVVLLVLASCSAGCVGDGLVLGSNTRPAHAHGGRQEFVRVKGRRVECWVAPSPAAAAVGAQPEAFVLFFIGRGDRADHWTTAVARTWGDRPVEVWGMNYPGSGGSDGPAQLARVAPAALGVYDAIHKLAKGRPVFVQAASFGTAPALCVAARRPVSGVLLWNPPPLRELIIGHYGWWNLWLLAGPAAAQIPPELDSIANARKARAPAAFVLCGADRVIPPRYQRRVVTVYAGPKRLIEMPGAGHSSPLTPEAAGEMARAIDWIWGETGLRKN